MSAVGVADHHAVRCAAGAQDHLDGEPLFDRLMIDAALYSDVTHETRETRYFDLLADRHVCFENHIQGDTQLTALLDALCDEWYNKAFGYELAVKAHVFGLLVTLFRRHVYSHSSFRRLVDNIERYDRIKPALLLMTEAPDEHLTLETLASACNLSASHFCRLFREITGLPPIRYLLDVRLQKAATLLKRTDKSVAQVAFEVGFDDAGYFTRKFKAAFGMTPTEAKRHYIG